MKVVGRFLRPAFASGGESAYCRRISGHQHGRRWLEEPTHAFAPNPHEAKQLRVQSSHRNAENSTDIVEGCREIFVPALENGAEHPVTARSKALRAYAGSQRLRLGSTTFS